MRLLVAVETEITGFKTLKEQYINEEDFKEVLNKCSTHQNVSGFLIHGGFLFKANKCAFQRGPCERKSCGNFMVVDWAATWDVTRQSRWSPTVTTGHNWRETWGKSSNTVEFVRKQKDIPKIPVCTLPCPFRRWFGRIYRWISCLDYHELRGAKIPSWWWSTGFQK